VLSEIVAANEFVTEYPNAGSSAIWAALKVDAVIASLNFE
jgi:hypothetical protein